MSEITYKEIQISDIYSVKPLWEELTIDHKSKSEHFEDSYDINNFENRIGHVILKGKVNTLVAYDDNVMIGYCISSINNKFAGEIDSIYIKPEYRGIHIGSTLIEKSLKWLKDGNVKSIKIEAICGNERVLKLYESFGFRIKTYTLYSTDEGMTAPPGFIA